MTPPPGPGRPRDPRTDTSILDATLASLLDVGYADTSIGAIATRAGVGKDSIYRRWSGKPELVYDAVFAASGEAPVPDNGTLLEDLEALAELLVAEFTAPAAAAALPGVLADFAADPALRTRLRTHFLAPAKARLVDVFDRAAARGEMSGAVPVDLVLDTLAGAVFFHVGLLGEPSTRDLAHRLASIVGSGIVTR